METSSRLLELQDNIFISVVSEYGDSEEEEAIEEEEEDLAVSNQELWNLTEMELRWVLTGETKE